MRNRFYVLDDAPTDAELAAVKGQIIDGALTGHDGQHIVLIDEEQYEIPEWALIGDEMNVPEANDHTCWNCGATQPAPEGDTVRLRERQLANRKLNVRVNHRPETDPDAPTPRGRGNRRRA